MNIPSLPFTGRPAPLALLPLLALTVSVLPGPGVGRAADPADPAIASGAIPPALAKALPKLPGGILPPTPSAAPPQAPEGGNPAELPGEAQALAAANGAPDASAGAPGSAPPGGPDAAAGGETANLDFLQRSNLIHSKILDNDRAVDPFGLTMDPANAKAIPVLADQYTEVEETPVLNQSSLKSAIETLPITGVYPGRELIVIGARSFEVGGQFGMRLQDLVIRLRFEGIKEGEIFFKDMETREVTSIPFNPRPAEFEPLHKGEKRKPGEGIQAMNELYIAN